MSDDLPERPQAKLTLLPLEGLGIAQLRTYVIELQAEIARAQAMIARKQDHLGAAERVFGKPHSQDTDGPQDTDRE